MTLRIGIVTDNNDPEGLRRVKVMSQDRGVSVSDWLQRITNYSDEDLPVPKIGDTVVIGSIDEDTHNDLVLGVLQSQSNNSPNRKSSLYDLCAQIGYEFLYGCQSFRIVTPGCELEIQDGKLSINATNIDLNATDVAIQSASLTWNGDQVAVVGGIDTRGDTTLS